MSLSCHSPGVLSARVEWRFPFLSPSPSEHFRRLSVTDSTKGRAVLSRQAHKCIQMLAYSMESVIETDAGKVIRIKGANESCDR